MTLLIAEDAKDLSQQASKWLETQVRTKHARSVFLPAGKTPEGPYQLWESSRPEFLSSLEFRQIDEVMNGPEAGMFRRFFEKHLPSYLTQMSWIDRADQGADVAVPGLGLNGHIAFHEPHLPTDFYGGCVELSETTRKTLSLAQGTWGLTYGATAFMGCRSILLIASGESKREVVRKLLARSTELPATALLAHADVTLIADRATGATI